MGSGPVDHPVTWTYLHWFGNGEPHLQKFVAVNDDPQGALKDAKITALSPSATISSMLGSTPKAFPRRRWTISPIGASGPTTSARLQRKNEQSQNRMGP